MENYNVIISESIRTLRKKAEMTQDELAAKLGVTFQAVSKWETAMCAPDIQLLPAIADVFGCSIDSLFSREQGGANCSDDSPSLPWDDDDVFRGVIYKGRKMLSAEETNGEFTLRCNAAIKELRAECSVSIEGDLRGNCTAGKSVRVSGDVGGNCASGEDLTVDGDVGGHCTSQRDLKVGGDVGGNCASAGSLTVDGDVGGNVSAVGTVNVNGDIGGRKCAISDLKI